MTTETYDDRAESFFRVGDVTYEVATKHCGLRVDELTHERWRQLLGLLREVDTMHDDLDIPADEVLSRLESFEDFSERYPDLTPDQLGPAHGKLLSRTRQLLKLGAYVSSVDSVDRFVALRVNEARHTANLLEDSATTEVTEQPEFHSRFLPAMQSLGIAASTIDSMLDARMDVGDGKLSLRPDFEYYAKLGGATLHHMGPGLRSLINPRIMLEFSHMSKMRLDNRLKNRSSQTTSLRIFRHK